MLKREVKERYVNNYNKEMLTAWNANMDIQVAIDPYAVISYMVNYINKAEDSVTPFMKEALTATATKETKERLRALKTAYLTHRQIGASEAVYRILPGMRLKDSNITCIFVATGFPKNRSVFYRKVDESTMKESTENLVSNYPDNDEEEEEEEEEDQNSYNNKEVVEIEGRLGKYTAAIGIMDRYVARPGDDGEDQ